MYFGYLQHPHAISFYIHDSSRSYTLCHITVAPLVCNTNANLVESSEGELMCVCREGYKGDGVISCIGQFTHQKYTVVFLMGLVTLVPQTSMSA